MKTFLLFLLLLFCFFESNAQAATDTAYNFTATTSEGKIISLSDYKGKYVLLDFWASWCRPCRNLSEKLIKLYGEYKAKGIEFIGIANEIGTVDKWKQAIEKDGTGSWPQVWDYNISSKYGVMSLPTLILIDTSGKIVQKFGGMYTKRNKLKAYLQKISGAANDQITRPELHN